MKDETTYELLVEKNLDGLRESIIEMLAGAETEVNTDTFQNDMVSFTAEMMC